MERKKIRQRIKADPVWAKAGILSAAAVICFVSVYLWDNSRDIETNEQGQKILSRDESGQDRTQELKVSVDGREKNVKIPVSGRQYDSRELKQVFQSSADSLDQLILGENTSLDEVRKDLDLITEIPDTGISVSWETDNYDVVDIQGHLNQEDLDGGGTEVKLTAVMRYGAEQAVHELWVRVFPPLLSGEEELMKALDESIRESDEDTKTKEYLILPETVNGKKVVWKYGTENRAFAILAAGAGASCMLVVSAAQKKKEQEKKEVRQMKIDYPGIINKFNLYIRAGMTIRRAWFLIAEDYEKRKGKEKRRAYEEMIYTMRQIRDGRPEGESYENFGIRCGVPPYRKFGAMLSQNVRKGSKGLTELLGREAEEAFEDRINLAKKLGEEAGTRLMIPMFLMLAIVFATVIVPAFFSIRI